MFTSMLRVTRPTIRAGLLLGGAALQLHGNALCAPISSKEEETIGKLLMASRLPAELVEDFKRKELSVVELMAMSAGGLSKEPPDGATVVALMSVLSNGSSMTAHGGWPSSTSTDVAEQAKFTDWTTKLLSLSRLAQGQLPAALEDRLEMSGLKAAPASDEDKKRRDENEALRKDSVNHMRVLSAEATKIYNRVFEMNEVDSKTLVETVIAFKSGMLSIAKLSGGKYGTANAVQPTRPKAEMEDGALVIGDDSGDVDLSRNGHVLLQIMNCLDSLVVLRR